MKDFNVMPSSDSMNRANDLFYSDMLVLIFAVCRDSLEGLCDVLSREV